MPSYKPVQNIVIDGGGTYYITLETYADSYCISGGTIASPITLASAIELKKATESTPYPGMRITIEWTAQIISSNVYTITIFGTLMPVNYSQKKVDIDCYYTEDDVWVVNFTPDFSEDDIIETHHIKNGNVTLAKLEALTSGYIIVGNSSNVPTAVLPSGDIAVSNAGALTVKADTITNAMVKSDAAIATSKLAASADIAKLANVTQAQLEYNYGVTPGTALASKALVLSPTKTIDEIDPTVLKINGTTVAASATELSQLNSAGVLKADFDELEDLAANGIVKADLALLAGLYAAGMTSAKLMKIATETKQTLTASAAVAATDTAIVLNLATTNATLTLPSVNTYTGQTFDIIIGANTSANVILTAAASDGITGIDDASSITITAPAAGTLIRVVNNANFSWVTAKT